MSVASKLIQEMQTGKRPRGKQRLTDDGHVSQGSSTKSKKEEIADKTEGFGGSPEEMEKKNKSKNTEEEK